MRFEPDKEGEQPIPHGVALVVGRDGGFVDYYQGIFARLSIVPLAAPTYDIAVAYLRLLIFDCVIVDQGGPAFEGRRVLDYLREFPQETPVLVVTRCHDMGCRLEAMGLGAVDYLQYPVTIPEMVRAIKAHLRPAGNAAVPEIVCDRLPSAPPPQSSIGSSPEPARWARGSRKPATRENGWPTAYGDGVKLLPDR
ncbi:MAG: response regulator [Acidobacteria bacterium]|nr:response regulator [Acidobacteriota bacterium]